MPFASGTALKLAGYLLAHAVWVVSELEEGEAYVPQALCETTDGSRELFVFEAQTQAESVERGKQFLAERHAVFERCAFARDGQVNGEIGYVDVLILDIVEGPLPPKLTLIQPYRRFPEFSLLGDELLLTDKGQLEASAADYAAEALRSGAIEHPGAVATWMKLDANRSERPSPFA